MKKQFKLRELSVKKGVVWILALQLCLATGVTQVLADGEPDEILSDMDNVELIVPGATDPSVFAPKRSDSTDVPVQSVPDGVELSKPATDRNKTDEEGIKSKRTAGLLPASDQFVTETLSQSTGKGVVGKQKTYDIELTSFDIDSFGNLYYGQNEPIMYDMALSTVGAMTKFYKQTVWDSDTKAVPVLLDGSFIVKGPKQTDETKIRVESSNNNIIRMVPMMDEKALLVLQMWSSENMITLTKWVSGQPPQLLGYDYWDKDTQTLGDPLFDKTTSPQDIVIPKPKTLGYRVNSNDVIIPLPDGSYLFSAWQNSKLLRVNEGGKVAFWDTDQLNLSGGQLVPMVTKEFLYLLDTGLSVFYKLDTKTGAILGKYAVDVNGAKIYSGTTYNGMFVISTGDTIRVLDPEDRIVREVANKGQLQYSYRTLPSTAGADAIRGAVDVPGKPAYSNLYNVLWQDAIQRLNEFSMIQMDRQGTLYAYDQKLHMIRRIHLNLGYGTEDDHARAQQDLSKANRDISVTEKLGRRENTRTWLLVPGILSDAPPLRVESDASGGIYVASSYGISYKSDPSTSAKWEVLPKSGITPSATLGKLKFRGIATFHHLLASQDHQYAFIAGLSPERKLAIRSIQGPTEFDADLPADAGTDWASYPAQLVTSKGDVFILKQASSDVDSCILWKAPDEHTFRMLSPKTKNDAIPVNWEWRAILQEGDDIWAFSRENWAILHLRLFRDSNEFQLVSHRFLPMADDARTLVKTYNGAFYTFSELNGLRRLERDGKTTLLLTTSQLPELQKFHAVDFDIDLQGRLLLLLGDETVIRYTCDQPL